MCPVHQGPSEGNSIREVGQNHREKSRSLEFAHLTAPQSQMISNENDEYRQVQVCDGL